MRFSKEVLDAWRYVSKRNRIRTPEQRERERLRFNEQRAANPEKFRERNRQWRRLNPMTEESRLRHAVSCKKRHASHQRSREELTRMAELQRKRLQNPEARERAYEASRRYRAANLEAVRALQLSWRQRNQWRRTAYQVLRKAATIQRTPKWANLDAIAAIYGQCARITTETGVPHHVDHFYPLQGRTVSGLHVETNLRIIPASDNCLKHNSMPEETS